MKRILTALVLVCTMFLSGCNDEMNKTNRIYVFTQTGCGHCENAHAYLERHYKNYDIKELNIRENNNMGYLQRYARKFKVPVEELGTPFIVMGDHYIMGWGSEQQKEFNRYAKSFKPQENK